MDLYTFFLFLGAAGLAAMAFQGMGGGHAGHGHGPGHGGHAGHGHAGHGHAGTGHGPGAHASSASHGHGSRGAGSHGHGIVGRTLWSFASPRVLFSICIGTGAFGPLLRGVMGNGALLLVAAIGMGILFERAIATPIWNFAFRFASKPALMLESVVEDEGRAVTSFDKNGQGLVAVDLDGQVVQLLATLLPDDRALGVAVRAGDRLRIAGVDSNRNRCTVSVI